MGKIEEYLGSKLNQEQCAAALHTATSSLILAGAGSGKTRTLTYKIAYLLFEKKIPSKRILAVTFTNKAANEMKERLVELTNEMSEIAEDMSSGTDVKDPVNEVVDSSASPQNDNALPFGEDTQGGGNLSGIDKFLSFVQATKDSQPKSLYSERDFKRIGTFHSTFLKLLKEDIDKLGTEKEPTKYTKSFGILDTNDTTSIIKTILKNLGLTDIFKPNEVKGFISKQKNEGREYKLAAKYAGSAYDESLWKVYEDYQKELEKSNSLDFDDLLMLPYLLFKKHPEILEKRQKKFDFIMVDEAQDTNRIQFELMKMLSGDGGNITLIGDDYQSIYGRRGALMENFLNVKKYWPDIQIFKLQINYRSRDHIVQAGNHIIKNNKNQYEKNITAHRLDAGKITCFSLNSEVEEAAAVVDLIKKMKGEKFDNWQDVAILYRTNAQSSPFEQILVQEGLPYKIWGAFKFFERKEVKDILAYIRYLLNPNDSLSIKRVINTPSRKIGKTSLEHIENYALESGYTMNEVIENIETVPLKITPTAKKGILEFRRTIHEILEKIDELAPADVLLQLVKKIKYKDYLIKEEGSEEKANEKYENIGQLINMAEKYDNILESDIDEGERIGLAKLRIFMDEVALLTDIAESKKGDVEAINLMTVHSSKGLEFPVVFIVGLEDNVFPLSNAMMEPHLLEEERRLMYVAITRAKDHIFVSHAHSRMTWGQTRSNPPSRFIEELPPELMKNYDLSNVYGQSKTQKIFEGDTVRHNIFGKGLVLEVWSDMVIVKFYNPQFGTKKVHFRQLNVV